MINSTILLAILSLSLSGAASPTHDGADQTAPVDTTVVLGIRPAVVGFFAIPPAAFDERPGLRQVSADLHDWLDDATPELNEIGVDAQEAYAQRVRVLAGGKERTLPVSAGLPVGYYLWSPQGLAYICRGVRRAGDLVEIVRLFLEEARGGEPSLGQCERQDA